MCLCVQRSAQRGRVCKTFRANAFSPAARAARRVGAKAGTVGFPSQAHDNLPL